MSETGHSNGSPGGGEKGYVWTLKMQFPGFSGLGSVDAWRGGNAIKVMHPIGLAASPGTGYPSTP